MTFYDEWLGMWSQATAEKQAARKCETLKAGGSPTIQGACHVPPKRLFPCGFANTAFLANVMLSSLRSVREAVVIRNIPLTGRSESLSFSRVNARW